VRRYVDYCRLRVEEQNRFLEQQVAELTAKLEAAQKQLQAQRASPPVTKYLSMSLFLFLLSLICSSFFSFE
jgi:phage shock protein A